MISVADEIAKHSGALVEENTDRIGRNVRGDQLRSTVIVEIGRREVKRALSRAEPERQCVSGVTVIQENTNDGSL